MTTGVQRIYIGGIDPQRLTIDDVSSRLRRLVDVVSIETPSGKPSADCFLNTGPSFFYLNAKCPPDEDATAESAATATNASPLQVLSKAYNNVKWKGCTLRVEEARPHFLDRLRLEREERERKERQEVEEAKSDDENEVAADDEGASSLACPPRNLRIRRRHGEEAFRVDTKPIDVGSTTVDDTNANGGNKWKSRAESNHRPSASETQWNNFGAALDKLRAKRAKHTDQYAEQKRRLKRQAKGRGPKGGIDANAIEDVGSLNGKVFLNRAVHIRFAQDTENDAFVVADTNSKRKDENNSNSICNEEIIEESSIVDGSSVASSDSDTSTSGDDEGNGDGANTRKDYAWSDDDADESGADEANEGIKGKTDDDREDASSVSDAGSVESNDVWKPKAEIQSNEADKINAAPPSSGYAWSDDSSDDDSSDDEAPQQPIGRSRDMARSFSSLKPVDYDKPNGCRDCSKPADYDEFSSAVDFEAGRIFNEGQGGGDEDVPITNDAITNDAGGEDYQLENDVADNLNVLGQLFPDMASIKPNQPSAPDENGEDLAKTKGFTPQISRPGWGVTGQMQRYDPNDSKSAKFEVEVSERNRQKEIKGSINKGSEGRGKDESSNLGSDAKDEKSMSKESSANTSTSSEDSDGDGEDDDQSTSTDGAKNEIPSDDQMVGEKESLSKDQNVDGRKEIYEQDKLEGIFQEARTGGLPGGFQMSQLFGDLGNAPEIQKESTAKDSAASGFSFGFDLGGGEMDNGEKSNSGFSFSFNMPPGTSTNAEGSDAKDGREPSHDQVNFATNTSLAQPSEVTIKRRCGLRFPEDVLDELEQFFLDMNEGKRILEDYEAMKADPESQNAWQEERKTLTLDWKRKQKFALSQKQKRRKYR